MSNSPSNLKRAQYTSGEAVTSQMFTSDQTFHIRLREYWDKALYGWGIVGDSFRIELNHDRGVLTISGGSAIAKTGEALLSEAPLKEQSLSSDH